MSGVPANDAPGVDVIGDVHGCFAELVELLRLLGYSDESGVFRHRERRVVFVGDLIDRGPEQVEVLRLVRAMTEAGSATVVMGNHEFNAIAYATPHPDRPGEYLRPHSDKNNGQHEAFLDQIGAGTADHAAVIAWFSSLPLWVDLDGLRVVHACWDPAAIAGLGAPYLDRDLMVAASTKGDAVFGWVEHLCKGPEVRLPDGYSFRDEDGRERVSARLRWWDVGAVTYATACAVPPSISPQLPERSLEDVPVEPYRDDVPVIFGHYWRRWPDVELTDAAACVDYSAVDGGPLVAYRWSGEARLTPANLMTSMA